MKSNSQINRSLNVLNLHQVSLKGGRHERLGICFSEPAGKAQEAPIEIKILFYKVNSLKNEMISLLIRTGIFGYGETLNPIS